MPIFQKSPTAPAGQFTISVGGGSYTWNDALLAQVTVIDPYSVGYLHNHPWVQMVPGSDLTTPQQFARPIYYTTEADAEPQLNEVLTKTNDGFRFLPGGTSGSWREPVALTTNLPPANNAHGDIRLVLADFSLYAWDDVNGVWVSLASGGAPVTPTLGLTNAGGLVPVSSAPVPLKQGIAAGNLGGDYRLRYPLPASVTTMSMVLANWYVRSTGATPAFQEDVGPNAVTVTASFEKADGTVVPLISSQALQPGDTLTPTPVTVNYASTDGYLYVRIFVTVADTAKQWLVADVANATQQLYTASPVDQTGASGPLTTPTAATTAYAPIALVGTFT